MIEIQDKNVEQYVLFPKNSSEALSGYTLTLHSELTQMDYTFDVSDAGRSRRYYKFNLLLNEVQDGEYNYSISDLDTGIIRIGVIDIAPYMQYDMSDDIIIQYDPYSASSAIYQNKVFSADTNGEYEITPDTGYEAISKVNLTVNVPVQDWWDSGYTSGSTDGYESGYEEGYTSGSTDGKVIGFNSGYTNGYNEGESDGYSNGRAYQKSLLGTLNANNNGSYTSENGYNTVNVNVPTGSVINNQNKSISITANTATTVTFDAGYTGLGNVGINVNVPQTGHTDAELQQAYNNGVNDGISEQKAKLVATAITSNGVYSRTDGYSSINVNVPTGSTINNQNKTVNFSANTATTVTFDPGYTGLGTVGININVPQTGYTQDDLDNAYSSGYTSGYSLGYVSGIVEGKEIGFQSGYTNGYNIGHQDGYNSGYNSGVTDGKLIGYESGYTAGYNSGNTDGYSSGYSAGYESGNTDGYNSGYTNGWSDGYASGYTDAVDYFTITVSFVNATPYLVNRAGFVINYLDRSDSYTYTGSSITAEILPGASFIIIFNEVENYEKPNNVTGISSWGGNASYNVEYIENIDYTKIPLTFNVISGGNINFLGGGQYVREVEYKVNDGEWTVGYFTPSTASTGWTSINVNAGDLIQLRGNNASYADTISNGCRFTSTARYNAYGNIMSLINSTSFSGLTSVGTLAFAMLFNADGIVSAENLMLPATTLGQSCYAKMFQYCSTLTVAPQLPATIMANGCYGSMFYGCSSLTTAPDISHITTLEYGCCDKMFYNSGIQSIVVSPATPISYCYNGMFQYCTSLAYIKCLTTSPNTSHTWDWVNGVAANGTFVKKQGVTWESGNNGIPSGWTVLEEE